MTAAAIARIQTLLTEHPLLAKSLMDIADAVSGAEKVAELARQHGLEIDATDLQAHFEDVIANAAASRDLSDNELDEVVGGTNRSTPALSVTNVIACALIRSLADTLPEGRLRKIIEP